MSILLNEADKNFYYLDFLLLCLTTGQAPIFTLTAILDIMQCSGNTVFFSRSILLHMLILTLE